MKKIIFYYSVTGNCEKLVEKIREWDPDFKCVDIRDGINFNIKDFSEIGFITPVHYLDLPIKFREFIEGMQNSSEKRAFLITAYSVMPGRALKSMEKILKEKGFIITGYEKIATRETYPPYRKQGILNDDYPLKPDQNKLKLFLESLSESSEIRVKLGFWDKVITPPKVKKIKKDFGKLKIDHNRCTLCRECVERCQFNALSCDSEIKIDRDSCRWCYACFNCCSEGAISTTKTDSRYSI